MKYVASFSGGKDSTAMVLRLIEENYPLDEIVFFDTGMEFKSIYKVAEKVKTIAEENGIKFTTLKPKMDFMLKMMCKPVKSGHHYGYDWCGGGGEPDGAQQKSRIQSISIYKKTMFNMLG